MSTQEAVKTEEIYGSAESFGVESLIGRLREEGIESGRSQAERVLEQAKKEASDRVAAATKEADGIVTRAKEDALNLKKGGEDAVRLALRDTLLSLENELVAQFEARLRHLVGGALQQPEFLRRMILELCQAAGAEKREAKAEILLPAQLISVQDLLQKPEAAQPGTLAGYVLSLSSELMQAGMICGVNDQGEAGFRISTKDGSVQVHLTESAITDLMIKHMLPRFRALFRGGITVGKSAPAAEPARKKLVKV